MSTTKSKNNAVTTTENWGQGTICIQAGYSPKVGEARILPIFQSTTYKYEDLDQVKRLFALKEAGYKYSRTGNPTVAAFEQKITRLEGGVGAVALASGQAATLLAVTNLCSSGDHIVSASTIYGGSYTLFNHTLKKFGVQVTFIDPEASESEIQKAFQPNTKVLFAETLGNPKNDVLDFDKIAPIVHNAGLPLIVDNTAATPYLIIDPDPWRFTRSADSGLGLSICSPLRPSFRAMPAGDAPPCSRPGRALPLAWAMPRSSSWWCAPWCPGFCPP